MDQVIKTNELQGDSMPRMAALRVNELVDEVRDVVLEARKQAARIIADARKQAELSRIQIEQRAYVQGFERGQNEGFAEGERKAHEQVGKTCNARFLESCSSR